MRKKLPIGIQTFSEIRGNGYCYVDKTPTIAQMINGGKYYFLSRPRRFGKSLLISTLISLFHAERELFCDLAIEPDWDWSRTYPIIHISFGGGIVENRIMLDNRLQHILHRHEQKYGITPENMTIAERFSDLIINLHTKFGQPVVILVDEYDKPILDNLVAGRDDDAIAVREGLKGFYGVIKDHDAYLRFVCLTGVSKFSKVSLFSGLNNLTDITLDHRYAALCGYTQSELQHIFFDWLNGVDMEKLRHWYNGYNFNGERVYNPYDVLLYLDNRQFKSYWFETGSPSFLIRMLQHKHFFIPDLNTIEADDNLLSSFDVHAIEIEALLFQTGYLTIDYTTEIAGDTIYRLKTPNYEVWHSLHKSILNLLVERSGIRQKNSLALYRCLEAGNMDGLRDIFHAFFASIPHDWYRNNQISKYEGYYCSIVYCYFAALGLDLIAEDVTSQGRIDLTVKLGQRIFILEFKVIEMVGSGSALQQIEAKQYVNKYQQYDERWLIGVEFSSEARNIVGFEYKLESTLKGSA